jgi:hypothetical protein
MQRGLVQFAVLDKGLRSPAPGKQCEAILQFVPLLQRGSQVPQLPPLSTLCHRSTCAERSSIEDGPRTTHCGVIHSSTLIHT